MTTKRRSGASRLAETLRSLNDKGGFPISVLTDAHGFPMASAAAAGQDPDTQSAVVALVQKTAVQAGNQLGMAPTDEVSLYDADGRRLVCRPFNVNGHELILAILVPERRQSYRRLTNSTISAIRRQWRL